MRVERLEILVEEPSMEALLRALLPSWLCTLDYEIYTHQGKSDLLAKLPSRLRAYSKYIPNNWRVLILVDRDDADCIELKAMLEQVAIQAGLSTKTSSPEAYQLVNRIVVEELEAWYFGDWGAVRKAFPKIDSTWPNKAGFRHADAIAGGTWEAFERIAQKAGYFKGGIRKVEAATKLGRLISRRDNVSPSFQTFKRVLDEFLDAN